MDNSILDCSSQHTLNQSETTIYYDQANPADEDENDCFTVVTASQDENFVLAALFGAVEEGNLLGLQELLKSSKINISHANQHGETALHIAAGLGQFEILKFLVEKGADIKSLDSHGDSTIYWAARQGHSQIIRYLYEKGVDVDLKNKAEETAVHVAARYGHAEAIEQLCKCGANISVVDGHGETALHIAVWHGFPRIVHVLGEVGVEGNVKNKEDETALHCAAARGHVESVRCLLEIGVDLNELDKNGCTALHLALRRHHDVVAMMLISGGCDFEIMDGVGERAIHIVAREDLLQVCQQLCSLSCNVNVCSKSGLYPIHLAAKYGNIEIIRCLCLAPSCNVEQRNRDGITAEISALAHGYKEIADLLARIKHDNIRNEYIAQFSPTSQPLCRVKLKLIGHSGVGKTTLIESLKCGYFGSWFRRSSRSKTINSGRLVMATSQQSTTNTGSASVSSSKSSLDPSPPSTPTNGHKTGGGGGIICNGIQSSDGSNGKRLSYNGINSSTTFEFACCDQETSTKGIDVQQISISGVGDLSVWDFSGNEAYLQIYDHFFNEPNCIHAILFRVCDRLDIQINQVLYWLHFLRARLRVLEPLQYRGKSQLSAKIILIATHSDLVCSSNGCHGFSSSSSSASSLVSSYNLNNLINSSRNTLACTGANGVECCAVREVTTVHQVVLEQFSHIFDIHDQVIMLDSHSVSGVAMKQLKSYLQQQRAHLLELMPLSNGLLDHVSNTLVNWRKALANYPVLSYKQFLNMIRDQINPLASENHVRDVIRSLQFTGDLYYVKSKQEQEHDLIVLCPKWLTNHVIGNLLNTDQVMRSPISGRYSVDEIQELFPSIDALDLLQVLENLSLCIQTQESGADFEYEFACFIKQERPDNDIIQLNNGYNEARHCSNETESSSGSSSQEDEVTICEPSPSNAQMIRGGGAPHVDQLDGPSADMIHGGVRLQCSGDIPSGTLLTCLFARLQTMLRSLAQESVDTDNPLELEQFRNAAKIRSGCMEAIIMPITLSCSLQYEAIEIQVKCSRRKSSECFHFFYDLLAFIESCIGLMCPGLLLYRHYLSPSELAARKLNPLTYSPSHLINTVLFSQKPLQEIVSQRPSSSQSSSYSPSPSFNFKDNRETACEKLADIISFGHTDLHMFTNEFNQRSSDAPFAKIRNISPSQIGQVSLNPTLVPNLHINNIPLPIKQKLCNLLDPPDSMGKDWCLLGIKLGLTDKLPKLDPGINSTISPTWKVLEECGHNPECTVALLVKNLQELGRSEAAESVLSSVPILKVFPLFYSLERNSALTDGSLAPPSATSSASQASSTNLSR
ncbi:death-associated protein kinase 1-like isoform X2 [Brevipalpus obovatus]|uniref:death-associated protein kinase 1-like isoform X2 n=1 Tax=Brevipalpus obovatus TaxID=246614 RepID=UPI003D9E0A10